MHADEEEEPLREADLPLSSLEYTDDPAELAKRAGVRRDRGTRVTEGRRQSINHGTTDTPGGGEYEPQADRDE